MSTSEELDSKLPILDARVGHDPRNWQYPFRALVATRPRRRKRQLQHGIVLDQGREGACVGFGWTGELLASPRRSKTPVSEAKGNAFALSVYKDAQKIDEWEGEGYYGTSINAGAKIIQSKGLIDSYRWCFNVDDIIDALILEGPVVVQVPWYRSMYKAPNGQVTISGDMVGRHCLLLTGYDPDRNGVESFRWRNSWGKSYGNNGTAWISAADFKALFADFGEACVPIGRRQVIIQ